MDQSEKDALIRQAVQAQLGNAEDDLHRARAAFAHLTPPQMHEEHGKSGQTRAQVLGAYETAARKWRAVLAPVLALLLSGSTLYAADTAAAPKPRSKPSAQVTVKIYPDKFQGKKVRLILRPISTPGHCTAWIAADEDALWISALDSCRALLRKPIKP